MNKKINWRRWRSRYRTEKALSPLAIEWLAFAEQLANRQGTRMPDWQVFHADRAELEKRIAETPDPRPAA